MGDPSATRAHGMTVGARRAVRQLRAFVLILIMVMVVLVWRTFTEADRVRSQVHRQVCGVIAIAYLGPAATTAQGRQRQANAREFARANGCIK